MRKSFFSLIAMAVFLLFLPACGGDNVETPPPAPPRPWTQQFGTSFNDAGYGVALDGSGNIYITGSTGGNLDGYTSEGLLDIFLTKFDSLGNRIFTRNSEPPRMISAMG